MTYTFQEFKQDQDTFNIISGQADKTSLQDLKNQLDLIREETLEVEADIAIGNHEGILGETIDVLYTTLGLLQKLEKIGIDTSKAMNIIAQANLSKFPAIYAEAKESEEFYKSKGIPVTISYNSDYDVYVLTDENNKVRKSVDFIKADLSSCIPANLKGV